MKFLHIMRSVDPEGGGPIEALVQSDPVWRRLGHSREIVSLDAPDDPWVAACPIQTHAVGWPLLKRAQKRVPWLRYGYTPALVPWLRAHVADYDVIVVNGLWNYSNFAARCVLPFQERPYFVFTHGMLDPWFRKTNPPKHWTKQLVWWLSEGPLLHGARAVLFTSEGERKSADKAFWPYRFRHAVSGYGTADAPPATTERQLAFRARVPALGERPYLLFLARLHRKKGCDLLLDAFASAASNHPATDLVIAGPDTDGLRRQLEARAAALGIAGRVHWPGMVQGDAKWGALQGCEAFVLPSHGENFGIAVVEAMAAGKPVLLSGRVNIATDIANANAAFVEEDTKAGATALLREFLKLSPDERLGMGQRARQCFLRSFLIEKVAESALALLSGSTIPQPPESEQVALGCNAIAETEPFPQLQA